MRGKLTFDDGLTDGEFVALTLLDEPRTPTEVWDMAKACKMSLGARGAVHTLFFRLREKGLIRRVQVVDYDKRKKWFTRTRKATNLVVQRWAALRQISSVVDIPIPSDS